MVLIQQILKMKKDYVKKIQISVKFLLKHQGYSFLNDERGKIKLEMNNHTGSKIKEIKEYTSY